MNRYLFVYGTLRRHSRHPARHYLTRYCEFHDEGFMQGCLYEISGYPGAVVSPNPHHSIKGDIFSIRQLEPLLRRLDDYEECSPRFAKPHEYLRIPHVVTDTKGQKLTSWVYLYNRPINKQQKIVGGDYLEFIRANNPNTRD